MFCLTQATNNEQQNNVTMKHGMLWTERKHICSGVKGTTSYKKKNLVQCLDDGYDFNRGGGVIEEYYRDPYKQE